MQLNGERKSIQASTRGANTTSQISIGIVEIHIFFPSSSRLNNLHKIVHSNRKSWISWLWVSCLWSIDENLHYQSYIASPQKMKTQCTPQWCSSDALPLWASNSINALPWLCSHNLPRTRHKKVFWTKGRRFCTLHEADWDICKAACFKDCAQVAGKTLVCIHLFLHQKAKTVPATARMFAGLVLAEVWWLCHRENHLWWWKQ